MPQTLRDLRRDLITTKKALIEGGNAAGLQTAKAVEAEAVRRSTGTKTAEDRRKADYPFAKRHGHALWDRSTINVGRDVFRKHWVIEPNPKADGRIVYVVRNDSDVAEWLEHGTPKMFSRPLREALLRVANQTWNRVAPQIFETALRNAFKR